VSATQTVEKGNVLAKLGQFRVTALDAARVRSSRDYRMLTASWIVAPWEHRPTTPQKRAG